jgi:endonuclease YncB( thermonuclease family)
VVGITDGDSIKVMHNGKAERIRLSGIDCPEKKQPFGTRAKKFTSEHAKKSMTAP